MEIYKKAQIGSKLTPIIAIIVTVVVLFLVFQTLVPEVQTAGERFSDETKCGESGCFFNSSLTPFCQTNSSPQGFGGNSSVACLNSIQTVPLASLFSGSGIVVILVMVFLLLIVIRLVIPKRK